jgi:hypothetical protein
VGTSFKRLPLYNRSGGRIGKITLIDAADFDAVGQFPWFIRESGYAGRTRDGRRVYLHRELLGLEPGDGLFVDHINRNRLDNRRANLRVVTRAEQQQNLPSQRGKTSRYRGVHLNRQTGGWVAQCRVGGKVTHIGTFETAREAARAVADFRRQHMPHAVETLPPSEPRDPNRARRRDSSSRYRGVAWSKAANKWMAFGKVDGKQVHLGYFDSEQEAADVAARWRAERP